MTDTFHRANVPVEPDEPGPSRPGWDAYAVWRDRVKPSGGIDRRPGPQQPALAPPQGWDPCFVWLSRVKKIRD